MKRIFFFFGFVALLLTATASRVVAQGHVEIRNFHGTVTWNKQVQLAWWALGDATFTSQTVEYSTDGVVFTPIGSVPVVPNPDGQIYLFMHTTPVLGPNYYRLDLRSGGGSLGYSETIKVDVGVPPIYSYPSTKPGTGGASARPRI